MTQRASFRRGGGGGSGGGGGGVTEHGDLTGLSDDDHAQYLLKSGGILIGRSETTVQVVNTIVETDLLSVTLPTDLVAGGRLRLHADFDTINNSGGAVTYTFRAYLGATTVLASNAVSVSTAGNRRKGWFDLDVAIEAVGGSPAQRVGASLSLSSASTSTMPLATSTTITGPGVGAATEDLSVAKNLRWTVELSVAAVTVDARRLSYSLERLRP